MGQGTHRGRTGRGAAASGPSFAPGFLGCVLAGALVLLGVLPPPGQGAQPSPAGRDAVVAEGQVLEPVPVPEAAPMEPAGSPTSPAPTSPVPTGPALSRPTPSAALAPVLDPVPGTSRRVGRGPLVTYSVEVQRGLPIDRTAFAREVERILHDQRGWTADGAVSLQRVKPSRARFRVALASPRLVDELCKPLKTGGRYSCFNGTRAMINSMRWGRGAEAYGRDLPRYREYLINHEVGHALQHRHERCRARGALAPVMEQQTISTQGCRPNPWPFPSAGRG